MIPNYIRLDLYFDGDGNLITSSPLEVGGLKEVYIENNVLKDHLVVYQGHTKSPSSKYSCIKPIKYHDSVSWITMSSDIKETPEIEYLPTGKVECYERSTTFRVNKILDNTTQRTQTIYYEEGFYYGETKPENWVSILSNTIIALTIRQYSIPKLKHYASYWTKKDEEFIQEETEVDDTNIEINVKVSADTEDYNINILGLADFTKSEDIVIRGISSIFADKYKDQLYQELPDDWVNIEIVRPGDPVTDDELIEQLEKYHLYESFVKLSFNKNTDINVRNTTWKVGLSDNNINYFINIEQEGFKEINPQKSYIKWVDSLVILPYNTKSETENHYAKFEFNNVTDIEVTGDSEWLKIEDVSKEDSEGVVTLQYSSNITAGIRTAIVWITAVLEDGSSIVVPLHIHQNEAKIGESIPEVYPSYTKLKAVVAIDDNTGENYDPTALLFKGNNANVYNTIEAKDNTLFLGNYINNDFSLELYKKIGSLKEEVNIEDSTVYLPTATKNSGTYSYTPDMTKSSRNKKLFKCGEIYSLGLVFVKNNGVKSTVFYIGDYTPKKNPELTLKDGTIYNIHKPQAVATISLKVIKALEESGVIGIIPVYAYRNKHKVICQGFLNTTIKNTTRNTTESLYSQYDWFQRTNYDENISIIGATSENLGNNIAEFQYNSNNEWQSTNKILTLNTPEIEAISNITNADLEACNIYPIYEADECSYLNNIQININSKYLHSKVVIPKNGYPTDTRLISHPLWYGFVDKGDVKETDSEFLNKTKNDDADHYQHFFVYPWQRNKIGGEGPESKIISKKYFTSIFIDSYRAVDKSIFNSIKIKKASLYDEDHPSILKFEDKLYQGNVDYIINIDKPYKAYINGSYLLNGHPFNYPKAHKDVGVYAGYDDTGDITDPIQMRYRVAPHVVLYSSDTADDIGLNNINCVELQQSNFSFENDEQTLSSLTWVKCDDIQSIENKVADVPIPFTEGDYFYGRFDTLRTCPYTNEDSNSITDIVSGLLCSRVNLDSRCDINRGIGAPLVTAENFNIFNEVYNQVNNYFTFNYIPLNDMIYSRQYSNSIQWSMTKNYGNEIDDWCNIQDINTLDLDGNKGQLNALCKLSNDIIAFQDTGIAQILYNETMQIASSKGVPIEIANSGKVQGKRYLYENVGCNNELSITKSFSGIYFNDNINQTFFKLDSTRKLTDLCTTKGMKSWYLNNKNDWYCWYDSYTQEILFVSKDSCIIYSDIYNRFQCFASYENIINKVTLDDRIYLFKETRKDSSTYNTIWKKNGMDASIFFSIPKPIEIEFIANPEPTLDKTFTNIEFRADSFLNDNYVPDITFTNIRVTNEYQDTGEIQLVKDNFNISNLKKKFRMWHITLPKAIDITSKQNIGKIIKNRIRNPWCKINLSLKMDNNIDKIVVHDIIVQYI